MKKNTRLFLPSLALFFFSCNQPAKEENTTNDTMDALQTANISTVTKMFAAFNAHDWKKMTDYYAAGAKYLDPSFGSKQVTQPKDSIIKKYSELAAYIPDIKDSILTVFASGNKVLVEFISVGTEPGNKRFELPICAVLTLKDSLIVEDNTYYDQQ